MVAEALSIMDKEVFFFLVSPPSCADTSTLTADLEHEVSEWVLDMDWASTWAILVPVKPQTVPDLPAPTRTWLVLFPTTMHILNCSSLHPSGELPCRAREPGELVLSSC